MLETSADQAVSAAADQLQAIFGSRLANVAIYGSAAGVDYVPGVSDINLVAVVDDLSYQDLRAVRAHVARWRKQLGLLIGTLTVVTSVAIPTGELRTGEVTSLLERAWVSRKARPHRRMTPSGARSS